MRDSTHSLSRRDFVNALGIATGAITCGLIKPAGVRAAAQVPDIVVFSKIYQSLKLNYEDSASMTAEAGLQGVDPAVRPGGKPGRTAAGRIRAAAMM